MKQIPLLLMFLSLDPSTAPAHQASGWVAQDKNYVNEIHIEALDAFDPKIPEYRSWVFRFLNKFHNRTNDEFLERELLFNEGDLVDEDILEETERSLREHDFLGDVSITQKKVAANKVDVYVRTEDQWTLQINASAGKSAGYSTYEFSVEEGNFLGLGKTVRVGFEKDKERSTYEFLYYDPQFWNTRWNLQSSYSNLSDGWRYTTDFTRPFYSIDTRWAYGVSWDSGTYSTKLYSPKGGKKVAEIDTDHRTGLFFTARSWGERYNKRKFGFIFNADSILYPNPARIILPDQAKAKAIRQSLQPVDRESYQFGGMFKWDHQNFTKRTYLDKFGIIEDMPVGLQVGGMVTRSSNRNTPTTDYYQVYTMSQYAAEFSPSQYFSLFGEFSGRKHVDGGTSNIFFNGYAHYYLQMKQFSVGNITFPRQTLAVNLSTLLTKDIDAPFQTSLGENEGLRGYTFKSFTGQNRLLFNVENRIFTPLDFRVVGIGLAAFLDAGYVWTSEEHLSFNDLGVSAGIGLRIGLKKSQSAKVIRVDLAFPLRDETTRFTDADRKGYSISVSSGHIFNAIEALPKLFQLF
jgi:outer membrane protein assembly factor BamA